MESRASPAHLTRIRRTAVANISNKSTVLRVTLESVPVPGVVAQAKGASLIGEIMSMFKLLAATVAVMSVGLPAAADVYVDPAEHGGGLYDGALFTGQSLPYQVNIAGQTGTISTGGASVTLSDDPTPAVTAMAIVGAGPAQEVDALGYVAYYFTITGPVDEAFKDAVIPLLIHSKTDVFSTAPDTVTAARTVFYAHNSYFDAFGGADDHVSGDSHHDADIQFFTLPGVQSRLLLQAWAHVTNEGGAASATAYIDPTIMIDPIFANTDPNYLSDFKLTISDGIGNGLAGGVPEPASWALILSGFGALGAGLRSRRRPALAV